MADPKSIHEFLPTSGNIGSLFLVDDPDSQATSGYTTRQISMDDVGEMVNNGIDYTQDLSTENKKVIGAINELHGVDGYDVYDNTATYAVGDICIHSNSLQVCTTAVTVAEDFDSNKWSPTTIKALLALKQNSSDNSLSTNNKTVVGAINELNSALWEDLSSSVVSTNNIESLIYKRHKPTGLKFIYFEIKAGTPDNTTLISSLPNIISGVSQTIPISMLNYESIQLGIFSAYYFTDGSVAFRCKTPTSTVKVYASGFLL